MTEYFRIEGKNLIDFDRQMVSGTAPVYNLSTGRPPRGMSEPLTEQGVLMYLSNLPLGVRGHALNRGMSTVSFPIEIQAGSDAAMEQALHDLKETLREGQLFIESEEARGTQAVLHYKSNAAVGHSYKTIYYGELQEAGARQVLGAEVKEHYLPGLQLTLYMEPKWSPEEKIALGPNEVYCPGFEEDGNADGRADNWAAMGVPVLSMSTLALQGFYAQEMDTNAAIEGVNCPVVAAPAGVTDAVAYMWVRRPAGTSDFQVQVWDATAAASRGTANLSAATTTAVDRNGNTWYRVEVVCNGNIIPANNHVLQGYSTQVAASTFLVDKAYLKWDTTDIPDEWCDHWLIYNHYDTTEGAAHEGHQNYFDTADLKGTDEARLEIITQSYQAADEGDLADLLIARRNWWGYVGDLISDNHWLEAENATTLTNWAALGGLARCSGGDCISNNAAVSGSALWTFQAMPPGPGLWAAEGIIGRYDVFGMVYTDDEVNTQYRLRYSNMSLTLDFYNQWVKQPDDQQWQMIYLGEVNLDKFLRTGLVPAPVWIGVEYEKDAADTARLDCIWLLPKTDPEMRLHTLDDDWLSVGILNYWAFTRAENFDYEEKEGWPITEYSTYGELCLQGDVMTLTPERVDGQRLYFSCESVDTTPTPDERVWEAHGAANPLQHRVDISYLPQYQTPLD